MKILNINTYDGPNIWSIKKTKLIEVTLDLEELEKFPTNLIKYFSENLEKSLPTMISHRCSEDRVGGFFYRVKEGTWMGHVLEHLALELQTLAGTMVGYGRTRSTKTEGIYHVVYEYEYANIGIQAAHYGLEILKHILSNKVYFPENEIKALRNLIDFEIKKQVPHNERLDIFEKRLELLSDLKYHIGLSFAGEDRYYVKQIAEKLKELGLLVFYDEYEKDKLWGKDLYSYLSDIYSKKCLFCIVFISKDYAKKSWTKHELKNAQERAFIENREYILPIRLDNTEIGGINSTIGYINASNTTVDIIANLVYNKILDT
jgi:Cyanophycin synthase-like N-terminal domain/TIR domain